MSLRTLTLHVLQTNSLPDSMFFIIATTNLSTRLPPFCYLFKPPNILSAGFTIPLGRRWPIRCDWSRQGHSSIPSCAVRIISSCFVFGTIFSVPSSQEWRTVPSWRFPFYFLWFLERIRTNTFNISTCGNDESSNLFVKNKCNYSSHTHYHFSVFFPLFRSPSSSLITLLLLLTLSLTFPNPHTAAYRTRTDGAGNSTIRNLE